MTPESDKKFQRNLQILANLRAKKAAAEANLNAHYAAVRDQCPHLNIAEADYETQWGSTQRPVRVCIDCGIWEEGWGCGEHTLTLPTGCTWYETSRDLSKEKRAARVPVPVHYRTIREVLALRHGPVLDVTLR